MLLRTLAVVSIMLFVNVPMVRTALERYSMRSANNKQAGFISLTKTMPITETTATLPGESLQQANLGFLATVVRRNKWNKLLI
ncbi:hypothetical protein Trisim1_003217 [Trichoderma cf. simile WF8]